MGKIVILICFLICQINLKSQIIKIEKTDSFKLGKLKEFKEDGVIFNRNEYNLIIYNKDNINFNKKHGYIYQELAGGRTYCEKCKKEVYYFRVKKTNSKPSKNITEVYSFNKLFKLPRQKNNIFSSIQNFNLSEGYFLINGDFYKNLGTAIE
ncbi:hypothetical protein [Chryseobacterium sp. CFS15]|uniref:hypothetical protein n=1 Tax=Chryseobacterium sp. CFS15 TaxID=2986946 RepID=UPI002809964C|nr:hypothetical protein [Chryseobacterium sp. CFS15]MDQ8140839.1 hypothetical protein [Chryseobacterium sp. CFS15]